ncbi:formimidoylglutamase [Halobium salinum]|uniref:Formimidoylglutamase n=1 Tax=Halobium salinum TaxID=1364940 RepID=A0ABD5PFH6_9EURY|nr:formimidoylglutamase [Halobium salinum]
MTEFTREFDWRSPSADPNDETFGDVVDARPLAAIGDGDAAVLVGEPSDRGVIGREGSKKGPRALRRALAGVKTYRFDEGAPGRLADVGDVASLARLDDRDRASVGGVQNEVSKASAAVYDAVGDSGDTLPMFLGGDNSLTYSNVAPLLDRGSVGVVNLDAHLDVREVREEEGPTSGTPYRQLLDDGLDGYVCLGARHFETSTRYADYVREHDGAVVTAEAIGVDLDRATDDAIDALGDVGRVYVSVDLDVLDATAAPGVSAPTPGGLTSRELFRVLRRLAADPRVAGFEVVECAPPLDEANRTVDAGARAIAHFLSGYVAARSGGEASA